MNITVINPQNQLGDPSATTSIPISNLRKHFLVVGTKSTIRNFCNLPSQCTGITPSSDWTPLHQSWSDRAARGVFNYTLQTSGGQVSITCVDYCCLLPGSDLCFTSSDAIQALIRPPALARQMAGPSPFAYQLRTNDYHNINEQNGNSNSNSNNSSSFQQQQQQNELIGNGNAENQVTLMPSKAGAKHRHANAFVLSTVFMLIDTSDSRTVSMAGNASKLLDEQCPLLNFNHGNVPNFVFVALSLEQENVSSFPEVLLDDVMKVSKQLHKAKGRVDEVTLVY